MFLTISFEYKADNQVSLSEQGDNLTALVSMLGNSSLKSVLIFLHLDNVVLILNSKVLGIVVCLERDCWPIESEIDDKQYG
jgi:hypothetical protein